MGAALPRLLHQIRARSPYSRCISHPFTVRSAKDGRPRRSHARFDDGVSIGGAGMSASGLFLSDKTVPVFGAERSP